MNELRAAPNQLTLLRLCIVPFLVLAVLDGHFRTALALFILAGISDGLDGLLARVLKQRTVLGQYLDPVADKLLLSTLFLVLNHEGLISRRVTVLVFGRESVGLPADLLRTYADHVLGIPTLGPVRSLNLANAVGIALYESLRQLGALRETFTG